MYGYIRPLRGELKVADYERYQAAYCGLCRTLQKRYGFLCRFLVSYDLSFLALLLGEEKHSCRSFCPRHPLRKRRCLGGQGLDVAADCCVILCWWKFNDEVRDSRGLKRLAARLLRRLYRPAYKRAAARRPDFDAVMVRELDRLAALEETRSPSLDAAADCFASILAACGEEAASAEKRRILHELLYHVGRCIYILDAADDLEEDTRQESYNPLRCRLDGGMDAEELRGTLNLSQRRAAAALELLDKSRNTEILENILTLGLPEVFSLVLSGQWKKRHELTRAYMRREGEADE